jgi:siroheme synthase-like protein
MALFPFFINLKGVSGLIVGTGKHAQEKIEKLKPYEPNLTVISENEFQENILEKEFRFVIVAGEDIEQNRKISELCRRRGVLVNVVDDPEYCDFIFPALISHGNLSVGISTNGASPATGVLLKKRMEEQIPENMEEILDFLQEKRPAINQAFVNKKLRFQFYYHISEMCMSLNRPLSEEEFKELVSKF